MRRFFTEPQNINNNIVDIFEDAKHIEKVLRMNIGDEFLVFDGTGFEYLTKLIDVQKNVCRGEIISKQLSLSEPQTKITLYQGLPKSGKMEIIVQKAVELGVFRIVPVIMDRCVVKINNSTAGQEKAARWNKVSLEATKQCGRAEIPEVLEPIPFKTAVEELKASPLAIMPYEELGHAGHLGLKKLLSANRDVTEIGIIIGPEGGFSEEEAVYAVENGIKTVGLGRRILRTETVASAIIPVIMFDRDEF